MKIFVTGGAGFIGSHVVGRLLQKGHDVVVVDNFSTGKEINLPKGIVVHKMDISDKKLSEVFSDQSFDAVFHFAAATVVPKSIEDPINDANTNVLGMINVLENCRKHGVKKFIYASTGGALYGDTDVLPTPETHPTRPISPYGINKLVGEQYLYYYCTIHGMAGVSLRYSNVYGPRQDRKGEGGVVAVFIKQLLDGVQPVINGDGSQTRDFVLVDDIAAANILALENAKSGFNVFNISRGEETSVNLLFETLTSKLNKDIKAKNNPKIAGEIMRSCLDATKAQKELNWKPKYSLEDGIKKTLDYFGKSYPQ